MRPNEFKSMVDYIRTRTSILRERGATIWDIAADITDDVIFEYFWDYSRDMPSVNTEYLEIAIRNMVKKIVKPLDK